MKRAFRIFLIVLSILASLILLGVAAFLVTGGPLADLRPEEVTGAPQPDREARGRALLTSAWEAAGGERTLAHPAARFRFRDHWQGLGTLFNPWPANDQRAIVEIQTHSFNSVVELLNGPSEGVTWGIRDGQAWMEEGGTRAPTDDFNLRFMLPTIHYFMELPQRLTEAPIARWVEERTIGGRSYDVVFATWRTVEAHDEEDQYLVFIDRETGRIGKVQYTVREMGRFVTGTNHLDDQREIGGVWIPHRQSVTPEPTDSPDDYLHRMTVEDFVWLDS
ncbi:MAG: hypothetical protein ACFCGT_04895 [Sandaracinaceae bacterium]